MKKTLYLLLAVLLLAGCTGTRQETTQQGDVIITGQIKNRDFYPHVKELTLKLPFFKEGQTNYTTPIASDNTFQFKFRLHAEMCEVSIAPYAEHLYVQPGDSIHLEIDFKDILRPRITGSGAELNSLLAAFTGGGYYMQSYSIWADDFHNEEELDSLMQKEYQERLNRYAEFVEKHRPTEEVKRYIGELLKLDYYVGWLNVLQRGEDHRIEGVKVLDFQRYLNEAVSMFEGKVMMNAHFRLAEALNLYLYFQQEKLVSMDSLLAPMKGTPVYPFLYAREIAKSLYRLNDTALFHEEEEKFNRYVDHPYLRGSVLALYQSKKIYQENPKPVSDYLLYGKSQDGVEVSEMLPFMEPLYRLLEKYKGKMIYIDFWSLGCGPCMQEMEPLKELRRKYPVEDIAFVSVGLCNSRERFEGILDKYGMHVDGIEHIFSPDFADKDSEFKIWNQLNINSYPYYILINREGVIVNYGTLVRPSFPGTVKYIEHWLGR